MCMENAGAEQDLTGFSLVRTKIQRSLWTAAGRQSITPVAHAGAPPKK